jgi:hypothetical protein
VSDKARPWWYYDDPVHGPMDLRRLAFWVVALLGGGFVARLLGCVG